MIHDAEMIMVSIDILQATLIGNMDLPADVEEIVQRLGL